MICWNVNSLHIPKTDVVHPPSEQKLSANQKKKLKAKLKKEKLRLEKECENNIVANKQAIDGLYHAHEQFRFDTTCIRTGWHHRLKPNYITSTHPLAGNMIFVADSNGDILGYSEL